MKKFFYKTYKLLYTFIYIQLNQNQIKQNKKIK